MQSKYWEYSVSHKPSRITKMTMTALDTAIKLRKQQAYDASRDILFELIENEPNKGTIFLNIAWSYDNEGAENEALKYYLLALNETLSPTDQFEAIFGLACTYRCLKQYKKAALIFTKIRKDYPLATEVIPFYALCLISLDQKDAALKILFDLISHYPITSNIQPYQNSISAYANDILLTTK